jgi:hypothetical protein
MFQLLDQPGALKGTSLALEQPAFLAAVSAWLSRQIIIPDAAMQRCPQGGRMN